MTSPVIYAAAYLMLVGPNPTDVRPNPADAAVLCQLPCPPTQNCDAAGRPLPPGHISVRWKGPRDMEDDPRPRHVLHLIVRHHRHHHHRH